MLLTRRDHLKSLVLTRRKETLTLPSMTDIDYEKLLRSRLESLEKQTQALKSEELKKKIEEYEHWKVRLPLLKKEIEDAIGTPLDTTQEKIPLQGKDLYKKKREKAPNTAAITLNMCRELEGNHYKSSSLITIYTKVSNELKENQGDKGYKIFRHEGEGKESRWFLNMPLAEVEAMGFFKEIKESKSPSLE